MTDQVLTTPMRAVDASGNPVSGAQAYFYAENTSTPKTVYTTTGLATAHDSPLVADSNGIFAPAFHDGTAGVKVDMFDGSGNRLPGYPIDPCPSVPTGAAAEQIAFTPIAGNSATNIADAIGNNTASITALENFKQNSTNTLLTTGTSTAYAISPANAVTAYTAGDVYFVKFHTNCGSTVTLNVSGVGPSNLKRIDQSGNDVALNADEVQAFDIHRVEYDGTRFVITTPIKAKQGVRGLVEKATNAEATSGSADDKYPDVTDVKLMIDTFDHLIARGILDTSGTPAWDYQTGFSASVTDNGTGDYTLTFDAAEADTNYTVMIQPRGTSSRHHISYVATTTTIRVYVTNDGTTPVDLSKLDISVIR